MTDSRIEQIIEELENAGWPSVADDVRDGVPLDTVVSRLYDVGLGNSAAVEIICFHPATEEG